MDKRKILIVDDNVDFITVLKTRLEANNYVVSYAYNGDEGIEKAKKESPDAILLDVMMPKMDGYTAVRMLKSNDLTRDIPIIILTVKDKMEDLFKSEGVAGYLLKPYATEELLKKLKEILG